MSAVPDFFGRSGKGLERSWVILGSLFVVLGRSRADLGAILGGLEAVLGRCYSHARSVYRGGSRLARWAAGILFMCLRRMHGVTVFSVPNERKYMKSICSLMHRMLEKFSI